MINSKKVPELDFKFVPNFCYLAILSSHFAASNWEDAERNTGQGRSTDLSEFFVK